jgi:hypothetical protein
MTHAALTAAQQRGYQLAVLQATREGYGIYRQVGFVDEGQMMRFASPKDPPEHASGGPDLRHA